VDAEIADAVQANEFVAAAVLSGNRNFEGRISPTVRANYLASPPMVVAYALAGSMDIDFATEPLGQGADGQPVFLKDIWPSQHEIASTVQSSVKRGMFQKEYADVFRGDDEWAALDVPEGSLYAWDEYSTYVKNPPYFDGMEEEPGPMRDISGARVLVKVGDSVTTDHISPAGNIAADSPAAAYLWDHDVQRSDFNSYGSRRGNHEVMMRGTFANIRLRNEIAPGTEGGITRHLPDGEQMSIFDAAMKYRDEGTASIIIAGKEYGTGSSRDWAGKGPRLLGVSAAIAESYERIHRSNLIGMGILPLQFLDGEGAGPLGLTGFESYSVSGIADGLTPGKRLRVTATDDSGAERSFEVICRIDTPVELEYYRHGGILQFVLRGLMAD